MASIHNAITRQNFNKAVRGALGIAKSDPALERFSETLDVTMDLWSMPEWAFLRGELLWASGVTQVAVAAEFSGAAVVNPVGSQSLVIVDDISAGGNTTNLLISDAVSLAQIQATYTLTILAQPRDQRAWPDITAPGVPPTSVQIWLGSDPASLAGIRAEKLAVAATATSVATSTPFILAPGGVLHCEATIVNLGVDFNFSGRVRPAYSGEL